MLPLTTTEMATHTDGISSQLRRKTNREMTAVGKDIFERLSAGRLQQAREALEQQRKNANPILLWAQECIDKNAIELDRGPYGVAARFSLEITIVTKHLYESCVSYCRCQGVRPPNKIEFGVACTKMFGPREHVEDGGKRPLGYYVPWREIWQEKLDKRLGFPKQFVARDSLTGTHL
jgi:hypothetical protein